MTPNKSKEFGNELLCSIYGRKTPWLNTISYQVDKQITFYKKQNHPTFLLINILKIISFSFDIFHLNNQ